MAAAGGGSGLSGRRPALLAPDGAVEALPCPTLLPVAVQPLVRVSGGGASMSPNIPNNLIQALIINDCIDQCQQDAALTGCWLRLRSVLTRVGAKKQESQHLDKNNGVCSIDEPSHKIPAHAVVL